MRRRRTTDEDLTGLAGWLYADLLLGLVVVFLGTVTVVLLGSSAGSGSAAITDRPLVTTTIAKTSTTTSTTLPTKKVKTFYQKALEVRFTPSQTDFIREEVKKFIEVEGLEGEPEVALVLLFGGVSENEDRNNGALRAARLWPELISSLPDIFSDRALLRPLNSKSLSPGVFSAEIFFQYFVDGDS